MSLNVSSWKPFPIEALFDVVLARGDLKSDLCDAGDIPLISSGEDNNGVVNHISSAHAAESDIFDGNTITVDMFCHAFYQPHHFFAVSHGRVNILVPKFKMSPSIGLFIATLINREIYKYSYGRAVYSGVVAKMELLLPTLNDETPDWNYMESLIASLNCRPISTTRSGKKGLSLSDTVSWKPFLLHKLFNAGMGNGIDAVLTTNYSPKYNYVSRDSNGNGVVGFVDEIEGEEPFPAGAMSLALGGSFLGSCFIQHEPFYTAQNVGVLQEKVPLSNYTKLFIATLIRNECKVKFQAFGRELNSHFRKDFILKLPVLCKNGEPEIDKDKQFSDEGYIPDWRWMEDYMKSLPFSDRI